MLKYIIFIIAILSINFALAQEQKEVTNYYNLVDVNKGTAKIKSIGKIDENGFSIGKWKFFLENGDLEYIIDFTLNVSEKYYSSGKLKEKGEFNPDTGKHIGKWIYYNKDGTIDIEKDKKQL